MNKPLTDAERATIMDACQSISRSADALKECHTVDGDWGDDVDAKAFYDAELRLLERLTALLATQQPEPRDEVTGEDFAKLKRFAGLVLKDHRNGGYPGDVDGGEIQGYAEQCGLIEERRMESPCGENCSCTDFGEFPTTCYFNTELGKAVINAARAGGES
ncbi:hypothetical protein KDW37_31315 [Burkholderia cenocepacia]|uniref:hypothetical protein n=1 Tax=Burkholderia cenocepacia TaxID=95486 RepID=UPI001B8DEAF4|nr:hypothetical protein [Burkholderia cenocepacia]MBR8435249.1 hypothetical protein [Burkholderia cenocepacia]